MDKQLFPDCAPLQRKQMLHDNADQLIEMGYSKRFTADQLAAMKSTLSEVDIELNDANEERAEAMAAFKERIKPLKKEHTRILKGLKNKAEHVTEQCYKFVFEEEKMVGFYNDEGELIEARAMLPEEMQRSIVRMERKTGTHN